MAFGIILTEQENVLLDKYMKQNNIKSKGEAIRRCIHIALEYKERDLYFLNEINDKLNRVIYKNNINNKLTEQIFCNLGFLKNVDVKKDNCLKDFYSENNYINDRMLS